MKYDYINIIPQTNGTFSVKGYDTYPDYSVLSGQVRINFIDSFESFEEAKEAYPSANLSHALLEPVNSFSHLPDTPDW